MKKPFIRNGGTVQESLFEIIRWILSNDVSFDTLTQKQTRKNGL